MKTNPLFIVIVIPFFTSCSVTKYTHKEVMDRDVFDKSKTEIVQTFGIPDDKKVEGDYEQWTYYGGQRTISNSRPSYSTTNANADPLYGVDGSVSQVRANVNTHTYGGGSTSQSYTEFIKIMFEGDKAVAWDTRGVDLTEKEVSGGATLFGLLAIIFAVVGTVILAKGIPI